LAINAEPYSTWYFFLLSLGFYFSLNVAMLALPVILWIVVCWRQIGASLQQPTAR
jgi:hypothetical protein